MKWSHLLLFLILMFILNSFLTHLLNERLVKLKISKEKSYHFNKNLTKIEKFESNEIWKQAKKQYEYINYVLDQPSKIKNPKTLALIFDSFKYTQSNLEKSLLNKIRKVMLNRNVRVIQKAKLYQDLVQKRLLSLQNSKNCEIHKKLICECEIDKFEFSYLIHFVTMCFVKGYYLNRMVLLVDSNSLEKYFLPLNSNCNISASSNIVDIDNVKNDSVNAVRMKMNEIYFEKQRLHLHNMLYNDLVNYDFVYEPLAWIIGQLLGYIMRNNNETQILIDKIISANKLLESLFVSVHLSKNEMETGCNFQLKEYMKYVDKFYESYFNLNPDKENKLERIVYLSSNDPSIYEQMLHFKKYKFITDKSYPIEVNEKLKENDKIYHFLFNLKLLAMGQHLICKFSSIECRMAYELKQYLQYNTFKDYDSLDLNYFMSGHGILYKKAIKNYKPSLRKNDETDNEIEIIKNDLLEIDLTEFNNGIINGNIDNGYIRGKNLRTNQIGLFHFNNVEIFHDFDSIDEINMHNNSKLK